MKLAQKFFVAKKTAKRDNAASLRRSLCYIGEI
jgi:hypothetical protein